MPARQRSEAIKPSALRNRGLDAEALTALRMRNPDRLQQLATAAIRGAELIAQKRLELAQLNLEQLNLEQLERLWEGAGDPPNVAPSFTQLAASVGRILGPLTPEARELTELDCRCGCNVLAALNAQPSAESRAARRLTRPSQRHGKRLNAMTTTTRSN